MESKDPNHPLLLFQPRQKVSHRTVVVVSNQPENESPLVWNSTKHPPCQVCHKHQSRYTCPRCSLLYCSVSCFQSHKSNNNNINNTCTEAFYQERVHHVLNLEVQAKRNDTKQILSRIYSQQQQQQQQQDSSNGIPTEQLYELLLLLEQQEQNNTTIDNDDDDNDDSIQTFLSNHPYLQQAILRDIQKDSLQEWLLDPWIPWWIPQLDVSENKSKKGLFDDDDDDDDNNSDTDTIHEIHDDDDDDDNSVTSLTLMDGQTLDQHILSLPSLSSLRTSRPLRDLRYNTLELVYVMAWTLRLYHGSNNIVHSDTSLCMDAIKTMYTASLVLSNPTTYFDSLEAVLLHCVTNSTTAQSKHECHVSWMTLMKDVMILCQTKRYIIRCLLEARWIFQTAIQSIPPSTTSNHGCFLKRSELKRIQKKIEFYASYHYHDNTTPTTTTTSSSRTTMQELVPQINEWIQTWSNGRTI